MKKMFSMAMLMAAIFLVAPVSRCAAQSAKELKITIPFDSLVLSNVNAIGNLKTGMVEISMDFINSYSQLAGASLSVGGFDNLGITDSKGHKYKVHTQVNASSDNKGYFNIPFVQFGEKKLGWVTMVKQEIPPSQVRRFTVRIGKLDKSVQFLSELHIRCILSLDYGHIGDKNYNIENIKIIWK